MYGEDYRRVMAMVYRGDGAIKKVRDIAGATNPEEADSTTVRGAYGRITTKGVFENVVHASSSVEDAEREIKLWFRPDEIVGDLYPTKVVSREKHDERVWAPNPLLTKKSARRQSLAMFFEPIRLRYSAPYLY